MKLDELKLKVKSLEENLKLAQDELKKAEKDFSVTISKCPDCGISIDGPKCCASITCSMAPKITC